MSPLFICKNQNFKLVYYLVILIIFCPILVYGQSISGVVKDYETNETIIGASVIIKGTQVGTITDINGNFTIKTELKPPVSLVVSFVGFDQMEIPVSSYDKKITVKLKPSSVMLETFEVNEIRISDKQKEAPLTVESMDAIAIKETPAANFYEGLGSLKGVDLTSASIGFKVINTRGFNSTSPVRSLQLIDGVDNQSPGLNFSLGNFLGASELDVMKVDLIAGASSAFYGPGAFNGVIDMTTKDPFLFPGASAMIKVGERNLGEVAFRYAEVFKDKDGKDRFAFKINTFYLTANDWEADNFDPTSQSIAGVDNLGGYDAINRYGDEVLSPGNNYTSAGGRRDYPGLGIIYRDGYNESDLVSYDTRNLKLNASLHYKTKNDIEFIMASAYSNGNTVYQGDNRYNLRDIQFFQNRFEVRKKDKFFFRVYATHEDAGNSYDAVVTAFELQNSAKPEGQWYTDYRTYWRFFTSQIRNLDGYPGHEDSLVLNQFILDNLDYFQNLHGLARDYANNSVTGENQPFYEPGTERFDSAFAAITGRLFTEGGSLFYDRSALYHAHGEYIFDLSDNTKIITGGNGRLYTPDSRGTIFSDTAGVKIRNYEFGAYTGLEHRFNEKPLKATFTLRVDKNQNFDYVFSPAASLVYNANEKNTLRFTISSAVRNPTLADQYFYYNVGRAILLGNLTGYDSLVTVESFNDFRNTPNLDKSVLDYFDVDPVRPEQVYTAEAGYRGIILKDKVFVDLNYYYSIYQHFIGFIIGLDVGFDNPQSPNFPSAIQAYRITTNSQDIVTTQGFSAGFNYYFNKSMAINGNYTWNVLNLRDSEDPIIPAYNTPEHKFNIGISGRDISSDIFGLRLRNYGFSVNYKWIQGFIFEGSPQFTGFVPTYDLLDAQVNYRIPSIYSTFKLGASNLLNNMAFQVYGGPRIGRLAYFSILFEPDFRKK
jgi:iron complex outermembrane recepter protein